MAQTDADGTDRHDPGRPARSEREARAVAALDHPNIGIYHAGTVDGSDYLVMSSMARRWPRASRAGPLDQALKTAAEIADVALTPVSGAATGISSSSW
jgi:hypothetical protein